MSDKPVEPSTGDLPAAEVVAFPFHRSHGATIAVSRVIVDLPTAKRSGRLNSFRSQVRKRLEPLIGFDAADKAADDLIRQIKIGFEYCERSSLPKQAPRSAEVLAMTGKRIIQLQKRGEGAA